MRSTLAMGLVIVMAGSMLLIVGTEDRLVRVVAILLFIAAIGILVFG